MTTYDDMPWLKSYDQGVAHRMEVRDASFSDLFAEAVAGHPERPAIRFMGVALSFSELDEMSRRFAAYLQRSGCSPGDVVGINLPNIPQYLVALTGALRCGCAVTGISPLLSPKEMAYQINDSGASVLVTLDAIFEHRLRPIAGEVAGLDHVVAAGVGDFLPAFKRILGRLLKKIPSGRVGPLPGKTVCTFPELLSGNPPEVETVKVSPDDTCLIQYTGGTTGLPKGAVLTHRNIVVNIDQVVEWLKLRPGQEVACSAFPLFHMAGLIFGMIALSNGYTQCLIPDPRNTDHICGEIKRHRPTILANVPSLYQLLLENPTFRTLDFSPCRLFFSGAAPFAVEAIEAFEEVVGKGKVLELYGMTETSPVLTMNPNEGAKKIGTVGLPISSTHVKLVDIDTGTQEVPVGEEGELIARGPNIMKGYLNKPEETAHTLRNFQGETWLYTGDVAKMDEDGFFTIADRVKDMLIVGGFKVFSREVEETLYEHPAVELCAIVGLPNPERSDSEIVKAVVQRTEAAAAAAPDEVKRQIVEFCRERMAPYKVPKVIEFVDELPLTAIGKVDKKALRSPPTDPASHQ